MESEVIESPELERAIVTTNIDALAIKVTDPVSYEQAAMVWRGFKDLEKQIREKFAGPKKKAFDAHKALTKWEAEELSKLNPGLEWLNRGMTAWRKVEEEKRREEEARLRAEAMKREEEERLQAAIEAEAAGEKEEAAAILETPVFVPSPVVPSSAPKVAGVAMAVTWKCRVIDFMTLVKAVAAGQAPQMCLMPDQQFLDHQARAGKGTITYPGVEIIKEEGMRGVRK